MQQITEEDEDYVTGEEVDEGRVIQEQSFEVVAVKHHGQRLEMKSIMK